MLDSSHIKKIAAEVGFDLCGIAQCRHLDTAEARFRDWLASGRHSSLGYMERNIEKRFDPRRLVEGAKSVVVCAVSYKNRFSGICDPDSNTKIASYACAVDYHTTIRKMLSVFMSRLRELCPDLQGRAFVDTAPLAEKLMAVEAGLGWIGRQSLLVTPEFGTYVSLGELVLCEECDSYDAPLEGVGCGECRRCLEACPTGAVSEEEGVDTRRCIACHTIEREQEARIDLHGWIFGCDECQSRCPYNLKAAMHRNPKFDPQFDPLLFDATAWRMMSDGFFKLIFSRTPLTRSGRERIVSNIVDKE